MPEEAQSASRPPGEPFYLDDGRLVGLRRAAPADGEALARLAAAASQVLVSGRSDPDELQQETMVAEATAGQLAGAAWLEDAGHGPAHLHLRMQLDPHYRHAGLEAALARAMASAARECGCGRLTAHVSYVSSDILASLRAAGLTITSCTSFGGTAEVELTVG